MLCWRSYTQTSRISYSNISADYIWWNHFSSHTVLHLPIYPMSQYIHCLNRIFIENFYETGWEITHSHWDELIGFWYSFLYFNDCMTVSRTSFFILVFIFFYYYCVIESVTISHHSFIYSISEKNKIVIYLWDLRNE